MQCHRNCTTDARAWLTAGASQRKGRAATRAPAESAAARNRRRSSDKRSRAWFRHSPRKTYIRRNRRAPAWTPVVGHDRNIHNLVAARAPSRPPGLFLNARTRARITLAHAARHDNHNLSIACGPCRAARVRDHDGQLCRSAPWPSQRCSLPSAGNKGIG